MLNKGEGKQHRHLQQGQSSLVWALMQLCFK